MVRDLQDVASAAEEEAIGQLLAATARLDGESTQSGILSALLEEGRRFASRTAFFLTRPGEVRGWASHGFADGTSPLRDVKVDLGEEGVWARLTRKTGALVLNGEECAAVCTLLGAPLGFRGVLIPFILRGELGGALYADRLNDEENLGIPSLQLLTHSAAQTIETAPIRGGKRSATLRSGADTTSAAPQADTAAVTTAAGATAAAAVVAVGAAASALPSAVSAVPAAEAPAPPAPAVEEPAPEEPPLEVAAVVEEEVPKVEEAPVEAVEDVAETSAEAAEEAQEAAVAAEEVAEETAPEEAAEAAEDVDFEMVSTETEEAAPPPVADELSAEDIEAVEDISAELEPEPELEDTSEIWTVDKEGEEPTLVGAAPPEELAAAPAPIPDVGQETVRLDVAALQQQVPEAPLPADAVAEPDTTKLPRWDVEPRPPEPAPSEFELEPEAPAAADFELEPEEPVTEAMPAAELNEDATIVSSRADLVPPPSTGFAAPVEDTAPVEVATPVEERASTEVMPPADFTPRSEVAAPSTQVTPPADFTPPATGGFAAPAPPKPDATGTTQVVPPTDIQGPGLAFAGASGGGIPEGEEALHEEARRLARLLVSEIKLYNEEIIEEGRRSGNIYERLKDDIDRSRQMYEERIDPRLLESDSDYFHQELVQRLAGGDAGLLGY